MKATKTLFCIGLIFMVVFSAYGQLRSADRTLTLRRNHQLRINTNLATAIIEVIVEGETKKAAPGTLRSAGQAKAYSATGFFDQELEPGTYTITVSAAGHFSETRKIDLTSNQTLSINLKPMTAQVRINIPRQYYAQASDARRQIRIFANNQLLSGGPNWDLPAGQYTIRIESGGLKIEGNFSFEAGRNYTIEPSMALGLR